MKTSRATIKRLAAIGLPITIPSVLIERLKPYGARFIKVASSIPGDEHSGKNAVEKGFQNHPYEADNPSLQEWLKDGNNYGVLAGEGIVIVETDTKEITEGMNAINTFTVQSGSGRGRHFYILSNATENGVVNIDNKNVANIQVERKYVVGAGCRHFTGNIYKIVNDVPIAYVSKQTLDKIFGVNLTWAGQRRIEHEEQAEQEKTEGALIPLKDLINLSELQARGDEYQGSHPIHGSLTGKNFCVNIRKNVWHCFRCNSGGGGLMWIAVKHGIIECCEAQKGALKGVKFLEALRIAREKGFDVKVPDEELSPDVARFFEDDKFVPAFLAAELMKEHHFITRSSDKTIFRYNSDNGIYEMNGEVIIGREIVKKLGKHYSIHHFREVLDYLLKKTMKELPLLPEGLIAVKNGILNVFTRERKPFNPDFFVINALPVFYDPNAKCPRFLLFLTEVVPPKEDRDGLQEFFGYCFLPDCRFEKALLLIGVGANGKSTILKAWRICLGEKNVTSVSLQEISMDRFALADLFGKVANICNDLHNIALKDAGIFLKLVSGDNVSAQEKFKGRFDFKNVAKLAYATNDPPKPPEDTEAYFRRWMMVAFPNRFPAGDPKTDTNLIEKLTTPEELSGILNWALDGLDRLLKHKKFTNSRTNEEMREQYIMLSDPQKAFVEKYLTVSFEPSKPSSDTTDRFAPKLPTHVEKDEVFDRFFTFCTDNKLPSVSKNMFGRRLPDCIPCQPSHTTKDGVRDVRTWNGIRFKTEEEMKEEMKD